jgi:hypothetical protein
VPEFYTWYSVFLESCHVEALPRCTIIYQEHLELRPRKPAEMDVETLKIKMPIEGCWTVPDAEDESFGKRNDATYPVRGTTRASKDEVTNMRCPPIGKMSYLTETIIAKRGRSKTFVAKYPLNWSFRILCGEPHSSFRGLSHKECFSKHFVEICLLV